MARPLRTIALLTERPAFGSLLAATLASCPDLRVRSFQSCLGLVAYARIAPVDLIVADLDDPVFDAELIESSGAAAAPVIGMTRRPAPAEGVDEVMVKPMSPRYLLERVRARLERRAAPRPAARAQARIWPDNVIPLFGPRAPRLESPRP